MTETIDLACKLFVDGDLATRTHLSDLATHLGGTLQGAVITLPENELELRENEDFHPIDRRTFPDGYLHFRTYLEVDPVGAPSLDDQVRLVARILHYCWGKGWPAVAACDYEDRLPKGGGYRSREIPWPA
ncbi:MAG: hypothetical protein IT340_02620 [Chloroflexi bacterium]|nr:hypothetical protein [Chloroflexota bacterium]